MSTGKMSKHDMKEDKFVTTMFQGASIAKDNLRGVILIVVVLVAFVAGIVIIKSYTSNRKETAQKTLGIAQIAYKAGNFVEARDSLLSLTEKYPKSKSAKIGNFLLGHIYFASGSPDFRGDLLEGLPRIQVPRPRDDSRGKGRPCRCQGRQGRL